MMTYSVVDYGSVRVSYTADLDGGGNDFGQAYVPFVQEHLGPVDSVFEWCAGPGFIGFALLAAGLCRSLDLGDVNPAAGAAVTRTLEQNGLGERVRFHESDCFTQIPGDLRWDLVVGNPPHMNTPAVSPYQRGHSPLIWQDTAWGIHRRFYRQVRDRLRPGGSVIIQENRHFSGPDDFMRMIGDSGLEVVGDHVCGHGHEDYYFLWSRVPGEASSEISGRMRPSET
jgi:methylase of polypeptide subunit release factors